ncbi:TIR domain-containing protein [Novosphingobium sp.]|uniref:TIR domain-containing protein n=1 Tax=Novosphingobium sp. TaxID=1874826 RepID=UPI003D0DDD14
MARMTTKASAPLATKKILSAAEIERGIARLQDRINELDAFNVASVPKGSSPDLIALSAAITDTLERCFGENTSASGRFANAANLQWSPTMATANYPLQQHFQEGARANIAKSRALLQEAQRTLGEDLVDAAHAPNLPRKQHNTAKPSNKVFVVHGHDDGAKHELARFLEKIELEAVILHEQANQGRTIIEKFLACADEVGFAVVLFTPDDLGGASTAPVQVARARQNVVFELGYFVAKLGRGNVCLMRKGDVEIPSDLFGVIYTELDGNEGWKMALVKELKAAGLSFDANKMWE